MVTIITAGRRWTYDLVEETPGYSDVGRKQWERGFTARTYDVAYTQKTANPYRARAAREAWMAGYDAAARQDR